MTAKVKPLFAHGDKVFAKVRGYPPWPARISGTADETPNKVKYHILFYGTGETAIVKAEDVCSYVENKARLGKPKKQKNYTEALIAIEEDLTPEELETLRKLEASDQQTTGSHDSLSDDIKKISLGKKTSLSPKPKEKKRKLDESLSEDSDQKKKVLNVSDSESSGPNKPGEVLSRSGRKIKPKRFDDETSEEIKSITKASPVTKKEISDIMKSNFLVAEYNNVKHRIPLNIKKPDFYDKYEEEDWNQKVLTYANVLKKRIETGEDIPDLESEMLDWARLEADEIACSDRCMTIQQSDGSNDILRIEAIMLEIDLNIRSALNIRRADTQKCIALLDKLKDLPVTPLMLKKHPEIVNTIRKIRRYIGSCPPTLSKSEEVKFHENTRTIREKAEHVYSKFQQLFVAPKDRNFWDFFEEEKAKFANKVRHLDTDVLISLVNEPEEQNVQE